MARIPFDTGPTDSIPGNPHAALVDDRVITYGVQMDHQALMAVAFELRTANLIALAQLRVTPGSGGLSDYGVSGILARMGGE